MNRAIIIGRLTKDPEQRTTQSGVSVTTFTVAVDRRGDKDGNRKADFIPVVAWRQLADVCARYLGKGRQVAVVGQIQTRSYDAQDGTKRYVTEIMADEVQFLDRAETDGQDHEAKAYPAKPEQTVIEDDDQLPF